MGELRLLEILTIRIESEVFKSMANTGLSGPYKLDTATIDKTVTKKSVGAYALDTGTDQATFYVHYVGRSDTDVAARLKQHVGNYARFKFDYFSSPKAAFEKECNLYHDFSPGDNVIHPDRPTNSGWKCPRCKNFD